MALPNLGEGEEYELRQTDTPVFDVVADSKIVGWRTERLEGVGFTQLTATALAVRRDIDLHSACRMVERGATHEQVARILL